MTGSWYLYTKKADFKAIAERFGIDQVTARILRNRDITGDDAIEMFLNGGIDRLYDDSLLPDIDRAAELITAAVRSKVRIRVVGDYDIDGVCSTSILLKGLKRIGAEVDARIPDRINDGYGINRRIVGEAVKDGIGLILTCDNGIAAVEELREAKEHRMTVVVTDHHSVRKDEDGNDVLPPADAVVDVKRSGSLYPTEEICGAVTAWKLIKHIYGMLGRNAEEWLEFIDFAAIATIGDIMPLIGENRIIVREGLKVLNNGLRPDGSGKRGSSCLGLRALTEALDLNMHEITAYHIGFVIGPCINAGGRLETAEAALRLFMTEDVNEARLLAGHLRELNELRKSMTEDGVKVGARLIDEHFADDKVIVVYIPKLHESLAGIVAGRLKESYGRPVIVITDAREGLKGSGRSIESYDMFDGLCRAADCMTKFGGHKLAAGLSLNADKLDELRKRLNDNAELTEEDFVRKIWIDAAMPVSYVSEKLIREMDSLAPFGNGFEKPVFAAKDIRVGNFRLLGRQKNVLKMTLKDSYGGCVDGILFGDAREALSELENAERISILYYPAINEFAGKKTLQIEIKDYRIS